VSAIVSQDGMDPMADGFDQDRLVAATASVDQRRTTPWSP